MPKAILVALTVLVTIGLTLAYAANNEEHFSLYLPHATRGFTDTPGASPLEDRVLALETQVARLSSLLTPTPTPSPTPTQSPVPTILDFTALPTPSVAPSRYAYSITASLTAETQYPQVALTGTLTRDGLPYEGTYAYIKYDRYDGDLSSLVEKGIEEDCHTHDRYSFLCYPSVDPFGGFTQHKFFSSMTDASGVFTATLSFAKQDLGRIVPVELNVVTGPSPYPYEFLGTKYIWLR